MAEKGDVDLWALADLCTPWCLHVAVTLRVAEHIAAGSSQIDDLAKAAGADPDALARVLRHLIEKGVFAEPEPGHFALNPPAEMLREEMVRLGLDLDGFGGRMARAWSSLLAAVRTGKPAYIEIFGRSYWEDLEAHPEIAADFDALMGPGHGTPDPEILPNGDWDAVQCVVDVGGRDRTLTEFRALAASAGLQVTAWGHQPSGRFVVECRPLESI